MKRSSMGRIVAAAFVLATTASPAWAQDPTANGSSAPAASKDEPTKTNAEEEDDKEAFRIGVIGGVGFPRPFAIEGMVKIDRVVGLGLEYAFLPQTNVFGVRAKMSSFSADLRVFPFRGAFFVGMRTGYQRLSAETTVTAAGFSVDESAVASTWFVNPRIGFLWTWGSGFTLGIDAGVHVPISPKLETTIPAGFATSLDRSIQTTANTFGNATTPTLDLLRIGFLF